MQNIPVTPCGDGFARAAQDFVGPVAEKTTNYTILPNEVDRRRTFSNRGAAGSVTFTLPAPKKGRVITILKVANQNILLQATNGAKVVGSAANKVYKNISAEGGAASVTIIADGTDWLPFSSVGTWVVDNT